MGLARANNLPVAGIETQDMTGYLVELEHLSASQRRLAARHLRAYPQAVNAMGQRLLVEEDDSVKEAIFNSLVSIGNEDAVTALLPLLGLEDANLRNGAIEALKQLPVALAPQMRVLLRDPDPDRRIFAVNICESLRSTEIEDWLLEVIAEDKHVNVCAAAVDLLGEVGGERACGPLTDLAQRFNGDPFMQFAVNTAIKRIGATSIGSPA